LKKKSRKLAVSTNGANCNNTKPVLINQLLEDNQIDAIRGNIYKPYQSNQSQQGQQNQPNRNNEQGKCIQFKKPGHSVEKSFVKFPALRPQNQTKNNLNNQRNTTKV
jgi:hypothetical protein